MVNAQEDVLKRLEQKILAALRERYRISRIKLRLSQMDDTELMEEIKNGHIENTIEADSYRYAYGMLRDYCEMITSCYLPACEVCEHHD